MSAEEELDSDLHYNKLGLMQAQQRENLRNTLFVYFGGPLI